MAGRFQVQVKMKVKHARMMHEALTVWNSGRWRFIPEPE
jgi:hypothetical protein